MEQNADIIEMMDLMIHPVFIVKKNRITKLNRAASRLFLREGLLLDPLFQSGAEEYSNFHSGMLYVTLSICGQNRGASVVRLEGQDVFTLDQEFENEQLRVLALAARELRGPLANAMLAAQLLSEATEDTSVSSRLNQGLHQLLRIIGNMSDASGFSPVFRPELQNADALFRELAEKTASLTNHTGVSIRYSGLTEDVACLLDGQLLERATLNMIANALKFTPAGGTIQLSLSRTANSLRFSVSDSGCGIPQEIQGTLFRRYLRDPVVEDSRHGIGLGMLLIRNAASSHGGAVLVDHPNECGIRISITVSIRQEAETTLRTNRLKTDYAGEQDHALLELSELLPPEKYKTF